MSRRQVLDRCKHLREDRLRYMQKWGLIHTAHRASGETFYAFADVAIIRQADAELAEGASFRAVLRSLLASRDGQLAFDFRLDAPPAKILQLKRPEPPPLAALMDPPTRSPELTLAVPLPELRSCPRRALVHSSSREPGGTT